MKEQRGGGGDRGSEGKEAETKAAFMRHGGAASGPLPALH